MQLGTHFRTPYFMCSESPQKRLQSEHVFFFVFFTCIKCLENTLLSYYHGPFVTVVFTKKESFNEKNALFQSNFVQRKENFFFEKKNFFCTTFLNKLNNLLRGVTKSHLVFINNLLRAKLLIGRFLKLIYRAENKLNEPTEHLGEHMLRNPYKFTIQPIFR